MNVHLIDLTVTYYTFDFSSYACNSLGIIYFGMMSPKIGSTAQKHNFLLSKKGTCGQSGPKKFCQGAKLGPTRNQKFPRDSLGYGDDILMLEKSVGVQKWRYTA